MFPFTCFERSEKPDEGITDRYSAGDKIESWLNGLLCLDATVSPSSALSGCPHPRCAFLDPFFTFTLSLANGCFDSQCELYEVSRDTLFSYHPASEVFLQRMMALYVASHYKNQPNDLQLMSDAPAHALFVLLPPFGGDGAHPFLPVSSAGTWS